ncbi:MAG: biotin--[acetyl-CoA-carboxylase] ligase [Phycisphaerales bacterium]|jgi:BirA family transcriptional regulator, biotin operon repressor / biotin---[acetyl-CoA-carboxylase] ligase|nr:biotin--[acetyl-CoA-carboxylase] ligase [Phycisphaerales bacterium]
MTWLELHPVQWFEELDSTNRHLLGLAERGEGESGAVVAARRQTAGRGRLSRQWQSGAGENLTFSVFLDLPIEAEHSMTLPLVVGLAVCESLDEFGIAAEVKWPNDVLVEGRKLCGILCERPPGGRGVVVGVGLNVNMTSSAAMGIDRPATSMRIETGREFETEAVLARVLARLQSRLGQWALEGFEAVRADWLARAAWIGRDLVVSEGQSNRLGGKFVDIGPRGELILLNPAGERISVLAGDASLREK